MKVYLRKSIKKHTPGFSISSGPKYSLLKYIHSPPAASMFGREHERANSKNTSSDMATLGDAVAGMVGLLSQTLHTLQTPTVGKTGQVSLSLMKCLGASIGKPWQLYDN